MVSVPPTLSVPFEVARHMHSFQLIVRGHKVTPRSGRVQACVAIVDEDGLLLCTSRGGLHRYVPLCALATVHTFPRGYVLVRTVAGAAEHNLLLVVDNPAELADAMLAQPSCNATAVAETDVPTSVHGMGLAPANDYVTQIPPSLHRRVAEAMAYVAQQNRYTSSQLLCGGSADKSSAMEKACGNHIAAAVHRTSVSRNKMGALGSGGLPPSPLTTVRAVMVQRGVTLTFPVPMTVWEYLKASQHIVSGSPPSSGDSPHTVALSAYDVSPQGMISPSRSVCTLTNIVFQAVMSRLARMFPHIIAVTTPLEEGRGVPMMYFSDVFWEVEKPSHSS